MCGLPWTPCAGVIDHCTARTVLIPLSGKVIPRRGKHLNGALFTGCSKPRYPDIHIRPPGNRFALACFNREQYDIPAGKQQHQPCVIRMFIRSFGRHHRVPHSKSVVHSHRVKTPINITHIRGVLWKKYTSVGNTQRLRVISLRPGVW